MNEFWNDISNFIFVKDKITQVDVLMVPGAPWIELISHVAELYKLNITKQIVVCGKYGIKKGRVNIERLPKEYQGDYKTESEMIKTILIENFNIPSNVIIEEDKSTNTYENALFGLRKIDLKNNKRIGICCQSFHARRVQMTFSSLAPDNNFFIFPVDTQCITKENWYKKEYGLKRVLGELERCGKYFPIQPLSV